MPRQFIPVRWDPTAKRILCDLPLTQPTGRVRLRREGRPIAARQVPLQADDMFEWQIAYRDEKGSPVELGEMWRLALRERLLDPHTFQELIHRVRSQNEFFDERFLIETERTFEQFAGFRVSWRKHPALIHDVEDGVRVEIEIRHRQRAVGFPMDCPATLRASDLDRAQGQSKRTRPMGSISGGNGGIDLRVLRGLPCLSRGYDASA
jgi:hypothetical protein